MKEVRSGPTQAVTGLPRGPESAEYAGKCLPALQSQTTRVSQHGSSSRASVAPSPGQPHHGRRRPGHRPGGGGDIPILAD